VALSAQTARELRNIWPRLDWDHLAETYPLWFEEVARLVKRDRKISAGLASAYYKAFRRAEGLSARASTVVLSDVNPEQLEIALRATAIGQYNKSLEAGHEVPKAISIALEASTGAATRLVLNGGRETVHASTMADPEASGWRRITSSNGCDFCLMLAGRGDVYSAETVDFSAHDHCSCMAEPAFGVDLKQVKTYVPSTRNVTDADRARARAWIREHL